MVKSSKIDKVVSFLLIYMSMIFSLSAQNLNSSSSINMDFRVCGIFEADSQYVVKEKYPNFCLNCDISPTKSQCIKMFLCSCVNKETLKNIKKHNNKGKTMLFSNSHIFMLCLAEKINATSAFGDNDSIVGQMLWENGWCFKDCSFKQIIPNQETKWSDSYFRGIEYSVLYNTHYFFLIEMNLHTFKTTHPYYCSRKEDGILESIRPSDKKKLIQIAIPLQEKVYNKYREVLESYIITTSGQ